MYNLDNFASQVNPPSPQEFALRVRRIHQERVLQAGESQGNLHPAEGKQRSLLRRIARFLGLPRAS